MVERGTVGDETSLIPRLGDELVSSPDVHVVWGRVHRMTTPNKKLRRKQARFLRQEPNLGVKFIDSPSQAVFVGNGGTQNGLSHQLLLELLNEVLHGREPSIKEHLSLCLPVAKDYSFIRFHISKCASIVVDSLNGVCLQEFCKGKQFDVLLPPSILTGPPVHLYLCHVERIPPALLQAGPGGSTSELPAGLVLATGLVSREEETKLLSFFMTHSPSHQSTELNTCEGLSQTAEKYHHSDGNIRTHSEQTTTETPILTLPCVDNLSSTERRDLGAANPVVSDSAGYLPPSAVLKHRKVSHYGYEFLYGSNNVNPDTPLPGGFPEVCMPLLGRLLEAGHIQKMPDQLTVNEYLPGAGIPQHVDTHSAFEDGIASISLGSQAVMVFRHPGGRKVSVFLPGRSVLVMTGESRYLWSHGIPARKMDVVHPCFPGYNPPPHPSSSSSALVASPKAEVHVEAGAVSILPRGTRVSLTFRKVKRPPKCCCGYPQQCDSQSKVS